MTSDALLVHAIKASLAATDALRILAIRARLREGEATTRKLADMLGVELGSRFRAFIVSLRKQGLIEVVGLVEGPQGRVSKVWALPAEHDDGGTLSALATVSLQHRSGVGA